MIIFSVSYSIFLCNNVPVSLNLITSCLIHFYQFQEINKQYFPIQMHSHSHSSTQETKEQRTRALNEIQLNYKLIDIIFILLTRTCFDCLVLIYSKI